MHLVTRNVNTAFRTLVELFNTESRVVRRKSRNGDVLVIDEPVTITYEQPLERVLFNAARDANPFFHLYEALWMLAGRNDVAPLAYYASNMKNYSDDGVTLNGAYGYRWRNGPRETLETSRDAYIYDRSVDQLDVLVNHLRADPNSRRAVLSMWNVEDDLLKIGTKLPGNTSIMIGSRDVCCNLNIMFSLRETTRPEIETHAHNGYLLDMTVTNRSNDLVWGLLGTNYVHFSFLQEYMAARIGVDVGRYHHVSNNLHAYTWNWKPDEWLSEHEEMHDRYRSIEDGSTLNLVPLVRDPTRFDQDLDDTLAQFGPDAVDNGITECSNTFLDDVLAPVLHAFYVWKTWKDAEGARRIAEQCKADDWRIAATAWLERRAKK